MKKSKNILKITLIVFLSILCIILVIGVCLFFGKSSFKKNTRENLLQISETKLLQFESSLKNQLILVEHLTKSSAIKEYFSDTTDETLLKIFIKSHKK